MVTDTPLELDEYTARLWAEYDRISAEIDKLDEARETIGARLRERCTAPGAYIYAGRTYGKVQQQRRFDVDRALLLIPTEKIGDCIAPVSWDARAVKRHLTPEQLEQCMLPTGGKPKLLRADA